MAIKRRKLADLSLDELVRENFAVIMDMHGRGLVAQDDPLFMTAHELLRRINPPSNYQQEGL